MLRLWQSEDRRFLAYPPGHYHSPLPGWADVGRAPAEPGTELPAIDLNVGGQVALLRTLAGRVSGQPFPEHPTPGTRYYVENGFFPYWDAVVLCAVLRHFRPRRVVEVGSGFSSAVMLDTRDQCLDPDTQFTFIGPQPGRLACLLRAADRERCHVVPKPVQDVGLEPFRALRPNDILFVDSSHVAKVGSDVNRIVFEVLPALRPGVLVHIHDIFWPLDYPAEWYAGGRAWNEAYLVRAFLQFNG
jgi:hypothetical protein